MLQIFKEKCFHHVLGASTQGCAFLMSSENLKTPCLLEGSKRMSAKHLGLHNISSPLFIENKSFLKALHILRTRNAFFPFFFPSFFKKYFWQSMFLII